MKKLFGALLLVGILSGIASQVDAQVIKLTGAAQINPDGSVIPTLTWCTETVSSAGATCTNPGPASSCTASGAWTGTKAAAGTQAQAAVSTSTSFNLQCVWPGADSFHVVWTIPTLNDDGTPLTDLTGFKIFYSTTPTMSQNTVIDVKSPTATSQLIGPGLAPATYYVVMDAYNSGGVEGKKTNQANRVVAAGASVTQTFKVAFPGVPGGFSTQP